MIRKNFYLTEKQVTILKEFNELSISEHIRRAIDEYIKRKLKEKLDVSKSMSK